MSTERVGSDQLLAAKSAALARRPGDRDPTLVPQLLDLDTESGLEDMTESGVESLSEDAAEPAPPPEDIEEQTMVPKLD